MKRFVLSLLILVSSSSAFSQKLYFIYLQSENDQPFFVKLNDKIHNSSASGYLILSRLRDSSYAFSVGFPENKFPEQKFNVDVRGKDRGYLLKNFGEKGWGLFDLQTLTIQMALPDKSSGSIRTEPREDVSPFTEILAKAANDPSLKERPVAVKMEEKTLTPQAAVLTEVVQPAKETPGTKKDTQATEKNDAKSTAKQEEPPIIKQEPLAVTKEDPVKKKDELKATPAEYKRSVVSKKSESSTSEGFGLTFIDELADGKTDTIRIVIPNPRTSPGEIKEQPKEERKFLDISTGDTVKDTESGAKSDKASTTAQKQVTNTNCKSVASESDLLKLQKKMAGEKNDDDRVDEARKVFKSKCFTTEHLKSLSALFPNDAGKYKFFDAAYAYVSDIEDFPTLASELKDEYYINRFKAMLR